MEDIPSDFQRAPNTKRLLNYLIDIVVYFVFTFVISFCLGIVLALAGGAALIESPAFDLIANVIALVLFLIYYFGCESLFEATPGKLITGTRVKTRDGRKPDSGTIALRTVIRLVPFEPFSFLFGEGWHDKWSKTIVVENRH